LENGRFTERFHANCAPDLRRVDCLAQKIKTLVLLAHLASC